MLGVDRVVLAAESDMLTAVEALERRISRKRSRVELKTIRTRYPMGAEKQIVQSVTRREVPPGGRAEDVRCVVFNVSAAFAVGEALNKGLPLTHRAVTVTGGAVARPRNLWVPLGTPLKELVSSAGGFREEPGLILVGGPMTGVTQKSLEAPVLPNTNGLLCLAPWEQPREQAPTVCIRCGQCVSVCPMHLSPIFVVRALKENAAERLALPPSAGLHGLRMLHLYLSGPYPSGRPGAPGGWSGAGTGERGGPPWLISAPLSRLSWHRPPALPPSCWM